MSSSEFDSYVYIVQILTCMDHSCRVLEDGSPIQELGGLPAGTQSFNWQTNVKKGALIHLTPRASVPPVPLLTTPPGTEVTLSILDEERDTAETAPFIIRHGRKCPSTPAYEGSCTHRDWDAALSGNNCTVVE